MRRITRRAAPPKSASNRLSTKATTAIVVAFCVSGRHFINCAAQPSQEYPQMSPIPSHAQTVNPSKLLAPKERSRHKSTSAVIPPSEMDSDPNGAMPQLVKIGDVCKMLALEKSAIYNLVATGELRRPLKFGTSRRAASRWLLGDVLYFVQTLSSNRPIPDLTTRNCSTTDIC